MLSSLLFALLLVTPAEATAEANEVTAEDPQEEVICRRQVRESGRVGERMRSVRVCKTRAEWNERNNRPRR